MKALTVGIIVAGLAVSANAFPGMYRFSGGYGGIHVTGAHLKDENVVAHSANFTGFSYQPTPAIQVVVRARTDLPRATLSGSAGVSGYTYGSTTSFQDGEYIDASTGLVDVDEAAHGSIGLDASTGVVATALSGYGPLRLVNDNDSAPGITKNIVDSTQGSVDKIAYSTPVLVNNVANSTQVSGNILADSTQDLASEIADSTQGSVNEMADSTRGILDSTQLSVNAIAGSTQGAIGIVDSTQVSINDVAGSSQGAVVVVDFNLRQYSTKAHSVTVRPVIPIPTVIPVGVFPRAVYGVYGSYGSGHATSVVTSTVTSEQVTSSTFRISPVSHHSTVGLTSEIKAVVPVSAPTEVVTGETTARTTSTITRSLTSTVTQQLALNPSCTEPSVINRLCTAATTITITVIATNVVASHSPIGVGSTAINYSNATVSSTIGDGSSTLTTETSITSTFDPCAMVSLPGFVGQQLPPGSQTGGVTCTAIPVAPITSSSTGGSIATATYTPSISAGTISTANVNVAFLAGFAAMAFFV